MLKQSQYNVIIPIKAGNRSVHLIFNTLSGTMDVLDKDLVNWISRLGFPTKNGRFHPEPANRNFPGADDPPYVGAAEDRPTDEVIDYMDRRGYVLSDHDDESRQSLMLYKNMIELHRQVAKQPFVIIPSYNCNLKCPYCWQRKYGLNSSFITKDRLDALFDAIEGFQVVEPERVDAVVFGGEPLQGNEELGKSVVYILERSKQKGYCTRVITNGVQLHENVSFLKDLTDLIQVTMDGTAEIHNKRRILPGQDTFTATVKGIDTAVQNGLRVNIRVNVDKSNIPNLPRLAGFINDQGWLQTNLVKVYVSPIKDHYCVKKECHQSNYLIDIIQLAKSSKIMDIFDLSGFPGVKYFLGFKESGLFSPHRFFSCEAQISLFVFDVHGDIYPCWDSAGLKQYAVGTYDPELWIDTEKLNKWRHRCALDIEQCRACPSSPICGGGCAFIAYEKNGGLDSPACDSMLQGFIAFMQENAGWLVERAQKGDHTIGKLSFHHVETETHRQFGLIEDQAIHEEIRP